MSSLWPVDMMAGAEPEPLKTLKEQADALHHLTMRRVYSRVDQFMIEGVLIFSFVISSADQNSVFELMRVRSQTGSFPCVIEISHFEPRMRRADNKQELDNALSHIFSAERTKEIIRVFAGAEPQRPAPSSVVLHQSIIRNDAGQAYCAIQIGPSHTYIDEFTMRRLLNINDTTTFEPLGNDQYVVVIPTSSPVRVAMPLADIVSLQGQVGSLISSALAQQALPNS